MIKGLRGASIWSEDLDNLLPFYRDLLGLPVAIQIPANTAIKPIRRFGVIGSPISSAASKVAAIGLTVIVLATRVGVARASAMTQRMKASAPPPMPR